MVDNVMKFGRGIAVLQRNEKLRFVMIIGNNVNKCQPSNGMSSEAQKGRDFQQTIPINVWLSPIYFVLANEDW
jgi:hypothetical protein